MALCCLAFLTDIIGHLNSYFKLQGKDKIITNMISVINASKNKFLLFTQININYLQKFQLLNQRQVLSLIMEFTRQK